IPAAVRPGPGASRRLAAESGLAAVEHRPVRVRRPVLAAGGVAADPPARHGAGGRSEWRAAAVAGAALHEHLVRTGLAGVHRLHGHLLPDGGQARLMVVGGRGPRACAQRSEITGQPRSLAVARSTSSGSTATGLLTASSSGRSLRESL